MAITKEVTQQYKNELRMSSRTTRQLKNEVSKLEEEKGELLEEIAEKDQQLIDLQTDFDDLSAKYNAALCKSTGKKKDPELKNLAMVAYLSKATKRHIWRTVKFLGDDDQLYEVVFKVLDLYGPKTHWITGQESPDELRTLTIERQEWVELYTTNIRTAINEQWSYVQSEQKKHALAWMKGDGTTHQALPTCEDMWLVVNRKLDDEDPKRASYLEDLFEWWVNCHLAACAGSTHFGDKTRRTFAVSVAKVKNSSNKLAVPPSTEAMAYVMYENCYDKWQEIHKWKEVENNVADVPKYSSKHHEETKKWKGKYSDSCNGQNPYGGWDDDGLNRFLEVKEHISKMRKEEMERILPVDTTCADSLFAKHLANKKRKNKDADKEPAKKAAKASKSSTKKIIIACDED